MEKKSLTIYDHTRKFANNVYVYPVLSRRSGGVSLGINLNTNNACNWRCVYCQVEGLTRGKPEIIDLDLLLLELDSMLDQIINANLLAQLSSSDCHLMDISLSGNGEPTLAREFYQVVAIIVKLYKKYNLSGYEKDKHHKNPVKLVLITNGSGVNKKEVIKALDLLQLNNGEVWYKIDSVIAEKIKAINQIDLSITSIKQKLLLAAEHCKTYIQTCIFCSNGQLPDNNEIEEYIKFVTAVKEKIAGVLLYTVARPPALEEGGIVTAVSKSFLQVIAARLEKNGVLVKYYG